MKTLITKTGKFISLTPPDTRIIEEIMNEFCSTGLNLFQPSYEPIEEYIEINVSDETFKFIESVATIEVECWGNKTYIINNLRFKIAKKN